MTSDVPSEAPDPIATAIRAVTSAYAAAIEAIEAIEDPDEAFPHSTALWSTLREATDANGRLRARLADQIKKALGLSVDELAEHLDMSKSRANQLLQSARAQRASGDA